jgi:hypothetical protein
VEVGALGEAGDLFDQRLPAGPGGPDRQGGLVADQGARGQVLGQRAGRALHPAELRLAGLLVHEQRDDDDDRVGAGDGVGVVAGRPQAAVGDRLGQQLAQVGLTREGLLAGVDQVDERLVDVDTDDLVSLGRELDRQRQSDLA